eukprot:gene1359-32722_t
MADKAYPVGQLFTQIKASPAEIAAQPLGRFLSNIMDEVGKADDDDDESRGLLKIRKIRTRCPRCHRSAVRPISSVHLFVSSHRHPLINPHHLILQLATSAAMAALIPTSVQSKAAMKQAMPSCSPAASISVRSARAASNFSFRPARAAIDVRIRAADEAEAAPDGQAKKVEAEAAPVGQAKKGGNSGKGGNQGGKRGKKGGAANEEAITPMSEDFSKWYLEVVAKAGLADYGPVRGTMVIRPYGYSIWEAIQSNLDARFKETGHENAYFPQLIPYSFIAKEAAHIEGFAPELAIVTMGGGKELEEPLVVRPTSETIVNHMFAQWVQSYRDLPLLLNQWCNVHRWEMRTRPFVRTLEFLWQEGHTAHATAEEAQEETLKMIHIYEDFCVNTAAMPVIAGRKSRIESFAGANQTYTIEAMMGDQKALQAGTSHNLGTNFAKAFGTQFLDANSERQYVHQTSWGVSTRMIGGIIMTHGDDKGLRLPPLIAPIVIIPIVKKEEDKPAVNESVDKLVAAAKAAGIRVKVDTNDQKSPGWKYNYWEMKGVPIRVEVGPKDVASGTCVTARRDRPGKEGKQFGVPADAEGFVAHINALLEEIQAGLLKEAITFREANIVDVKSYDELKATIAEGKWARCGRAGSDADETMIKEETQATLRWINHVSAPFLSAGKWARCGRAGSDADETMTKEETGHPAQVGTLWPGWLRCRRDNDQGRDRPPCVGLIMYLPPSYLQASKWARCGWAGSDADETMIKEETHATLRWINHVSAPFLSAGKWARCGWAGSDADETMIKEETQATLRCFPFNQPEGPHTCLMTGSPAAEVALFAKSY